MVGDGGGGFVYMLPLPQWCGVHCWLFAVGLVMMYVWFVNGVVCVFWLVLAWSGAGLWSVCHARHLI